jgi:hypothetical protein
MNTPMNTENLKRGLEAAASGSRSSPQVRNLPSVGESRLRDSGENSRRPRGRYGKDGVR